MDQIETAIVRSRQVLPEYRDELLGIPVVLLDAAMAEVDAAGDETVAVPDERGLIAAVAVVRCLDARKLAGREVRFLRKAVGMTQAEFAGAMDMAQETVSRWENDAYALGGHAEKVLRHLVCDTLRDSALGVSYDPRAISYLKIAQAADGQERPPEPIFMARHLVRDDGRVQEYWGPPRRRPSGA